MPVSAAVDGADEIRWFFDDKVVAGVRSSTADALPPSFSEAPLNCVTCLITRSLSHEDVLAAVRRLPDMQCTSDPLPTHF